MIANRLVIALVGFALAASGCGSDDDVPFDPLPWAAHKRDSGRIYFAYATDPYTYVKRARVRTTEQGTVVTLGLRREPPEAVNAAGVTRCVALPLDRSEAPGPIRDGVSGPQRLPPNRVADGKRLLERADLEQCPEATIER